MKTISIILVINSVGVGVLALQKYSLPWWHPEIQYIADERIEGPSNHPLLDDDAEFQAFIRANTGERHRFFDGRSGYVQNPWRLPGGHPNCDRYFELEDTPYEDFPSTYVDHPDIDEAYRRGKPLPKGHPSASFLLRDFIPDGHPDVDDLFEDPDDLPEWHPDLSIMLNVRELPNDPTNVISVYFEHLNATQSFLSKRALPAGHVSVSDLFENYLPPSHPSNLDEMLQNPTKYELPYGHPDFSTMMQVRELNLPMIPVYFDHPNATQSFISKRGLPAGHVSVVDLLEDYLPPSHPSNLDEMLQNPSQYELPLGHPDFSDMMAIKQLDIPMIPVYFDHPNATQSFISKRALPAGHVNVADLLEDYLPHLHPTNLDEMLQNPSQYELPLGHPDFSDMMAIKSLPSIIFVAHPDIDASLNGNEAIPKSHPSVMDLLEEFLPPSHPTNLDEMLRNPDCFQLPDFHPSLSALMSPQSIVSAISETSSITADVSISVFSEHPDLGIGYITVPVENHPSIHHLFEVELPESHPNIDELMEEGFTLPSWHPKLNSLVTRRSIETSPAALLSYALSIIFAFMIFLRKTRSWRNSKRVKEIFIVDREESNNQLDFDRGIMLTHDDSNDIIKEIHACTTVESDDNSEVECVVLPSMALDDTMPLPRLNQMHQNAMELNRNHHDKNLEPNKEKVRPSIIAYQEKRNTQLRSVYMNVVGMRIPRSQWSTGEAMSCIIYCMLNLLALLISPSYGFDVGFRSLSVGNTLFLVLSAAKNSVFAAFLGVAFDQMLVYHRFLGRITVATAFIHSCFYFDHLLEFISDRVYKTGFAALLCGIIIFMTSINVVRRRFFNVFFWSHFAFIGFIVCVYLHAHGARPFIIMAMAFYGVDKSLQMIGSWPRKSSVFQKVGDRTAMVRFQKSSTARLIGRHDIGQYVFVNFPELSPTEWHPFSVASGPSEPFIDLYIRALGNHTKAIVQYSEECATKGKQALIRADGPYGNLSFNYYRYGSLVLVGGGIGITPIVSILKDIYECERDKASHRKICAMNVHLVWIMPHASEADLFLDLLMNYRQRSVEDTSLPRLILSIHITRDDPAVRNKGHILFSKPDFASLMEDCISSRHNGATSILVYACGPGRCVYLGLFLVRSRNFQILEPPNLHDL